RPPNVAYRTEIAPKAEGYQRGIKDHESDTRVTEEKTAHKSSRCKNGVQVCEVLLDRMTRLGEDQGQECGLAQAIHGSFSRPTSQSSAARAGAKRRRESAAAPC